MGEPPGKTGRTGRGEHQDQGEQAFHGSPRYGIGICPHCIGIPRPSQIQISILYLTQGGRADILDWMKDRPLKSALIGSPRQPRKAKQSTRQRLLEAAGQVFAEKGFDRSTGKEICERARTNTAAVNYYFGGIDGLYAAVLNEARSRLVPTPALLAAVAGKADAREKLEAVIELGIQAMSSPATSSWVLRVLAREIIAPSPALEALWAEGIRCGCASSAASPAS